MKVEHEKKCFCGQDYHLYIALKRDDDFRYATIYHTIPSYAAMHLILEMLHLLGQYLLVLGRMNQPSILSGMSQIIITLGIKLHLVNSESFMCSNNYLFSTFYCSY